MASGKRYITAAEAKRLLAAIQDPVAKAVARRMLKYGERAGAALAALRPTDIRPCQQCGKTFSGISTAKYCTNACRQKAKRARKG